MVFAGNVLVWLMNALASVIRGTGNMLVPAMAICLGVVLLLPLSPVLIFGFGPMPALGIAGGGWAVVLTTALTVAVLAWYILSGPLPRPAARRASELAVLRRHPASRRRRCRQHAADDVDGGPDDRTGRRRRVRTPSRAMAPARGWNTC